MIYLSTQLTIFIQARNYSAGITGLQFIAVVEMTVHLFHCSIFRVDSNSATVAISSRASYCFLRHESSVVRSACLQAENGELARMIGSAPTACDVTVVSWNGL
ncbi:hypothetical protein T02_3249 [Trichinella nativa]|uniref:Uncharacterized protein n=1 Tax=Trichinella nativa TaxID=6335 RepID=A0A0V1LCI3_9BILA|nr:hypothetical protein T02_4920 [Trichinella nativa]KRZ57246.1 hypothetical protein T02_3249 [Trichinella nativa]